MDTQIINSSFIGNYVLGDNINYNCQALLALYGNAKSDDNTNGINKPIIILIVTIIEALLFDILYKINNQYLEASIPLKSKAYKIIKAKHYDTFETYIAVAQKYKFLGDSTPTSFYDDLTTLRKLRNRVHIQNLKKEFDDHEEFTFTNEKQKLAEKCLEFIFKHLEKNHSRGGNKYVKVFTLPWPPYFDNQLNAIK